MKKFIYGVLFLAIVGIGLVSCKKDRLEIDNQKRNLEFDFSDIYSDGRMLIFNNIQDYETLINDPSEEQVNDFLNHISVMEHATYAEYLLTLSVDERDSIDYDDYLSKILNEDCVVQIGDYLYKVNTSTEKVYVMHKDYIEDYSQLVDEYLDAGKVEIGRAHV